MNTEEVADDNNKATSSKIQKDNLKEEEYEEEIVVLELNGVLDGESVRQAARSGQLVVRKTNENTPLVQIGSSVYTAKWSQTIGTDMIFQASNKIIHTSNTNEKISSEYDTSEPTMFYQTSITPIPLELVSVTGTRLIAQKALISAENLT